MRINRTMLVAAIVTISAATLSACYDDGRPGRYGDRHHGRHHDRGGHGHDRGGQGGYDRDHRGQ